MINRNIYISVLFIAFCICPLHSQVNGNNKSKGENQDIYLSLEDSSLRNKYDSLIRHYERTENFDSLILIQSKVADYFLRENKFKEYIWISNQVGYYHTLLSQHDKSVEVLLENLRYVENYKLTDLLSETYMYLGFAYRNYDAEMALQYFNLCLEKETDTLSVYYCSSLNEIANLLNASGKYDQALQHYLRALKIKEKSGEGTLDGFIIFSYNDIAMVYENMHNYEKAIEYMKKCIELAEARTDLPIKYYLSQFYSNIANLYVATGQFTEAEDYLQKALALATELDNMNILEIVYQGYYVYYKSINRPEKALHNFELAVQYRDSLNRKEVETSIADLDKKYQTEKREAEIVLLKKENYIRKLSFIFILIVLIIIISAAFLIISKQIRIKNAEKALNEKLTKELEYKKMEIINFSSYIRQRISFTNDITTHLKRIKSDMAESSDEIDRLMSFISLNYRNEEKMINDVYTQIENINRVFSFRIKEKHTNLTNEDIRLASLLILNLTSKEIAEILFINAKSVEMKRYRLRKKLELEKDNSLIEYLASI